MLLIEGRDTPREARDYGLRLEDGSFVFWSGVHKQYWWDEHWWLLGGCVDPVRDIPGHFDYAYTWLLTDG